MTVNGSVEWQCGMTVAPLAGSDLVLVAEHHRVGLALLRVVRLRRGAWSRVTIDPFRHSASSAFKQHRASADGTCWAMARLTVLPPLQAISASRLWTSARSASSRSAAAASAAACRLIVAATSASTPSAASGGGPDRVAASGGGALPAPTNGGGGLCPPGVRAATSGTARAGNRRFSL